MYQMIFIQILTSIQTGDIQDVNPTLVYSRFSDYSSCQLAVAKYASDHSPKLNIQQNDRGLEATLSEEWTELGLKNFLSISCRKLP